MKKTITSISTAVFLGFALATNVSGQEATKKNQNDRGPQQGGANSLQAEGVVKSWKAKPQEVAMKMIAKYGQPDEVTRNRLIWHNNGPWKRTELVNEEIPHKFPKPHQDMLLQTISYRVPPEKFDELAEYDGSVIVERTKGEISARCDMEEANFLALNLAHEIVTGKRNVKDARKHYAEAMREMKHSEYKQKFLFNPPTGNQGDPDKPLETR